MSSGKPAFKPSAFGHIGGERAACWHVHRKREAHSSFDEHSAGYPEHSGHARSYPERKSGSTMLPLMTVGELDVVGLLLGHLTNDGQLPLLTLVRLDQQQDPDHETTNAQDQGEQ